MKKIVLISFLSMSISVMMAQKPADFSGSWTMDSTKSDPFFKDYKIKCKIKQDAQTISIETAFIRISRDDATNMTSTYTFGAETSKEEYGGINKTAVKWSPDIKVLNITESRTVESKVYGSTVSYKLSEEGKLLTLTTTDVNPDNQKPMVQVFRRDP